MNNKSKSAPAKKELQGKHYVVDARKVLPLDRVGGNIRQDYGHKDGSFTELCASVKEHGFIESIKAYRDPEKPGFWRSLSGHTRIMAGEACGWVDKDGKPLTFKIIPIDVRKYSNLDLIFEMVNGNKGRQLNVLEITEAVRRATAEGASIKEVAAGLSLSMHQVRSFILLSNAPKRIRDLISQDNISYWVAIDFIKTSKDYNEAIEKIEAALSKVAKPARKPKEKNDIEDDSVEVSEETYGKVTRRELNEVNNKVDSIFELKKVFKSIIDNPRTPKNQELFFFAKKILENKLTSSDIEKLLF